MQGYNYGREARHGTAGARRVKMDEWPHLQYEYKSTRADNIHRLCRRTASRRCLAPCGRMNVNYLLNHLRLVCATELFVVLPALHPNQRY